MQNEIAWEETSVLPIELTEPIDWYHSGCDE